MVINYQALLTVPRILEAIITITVIITANRKFRSIPFRNRPLLHQLILMGLFGWALYTTLDLFVYLIAPLSFDPTQPVRASGYDLNYPSLFIASLLKDITLMGVFLSIWMFYFAAIDIRFGEHKAREKLRNIWFVLFYIAICLIVIINEEVELENTSDGKLIVGTIGDSLISTTKYLVAIIMYTIASMQMSRALREVIMDNQDPDLLRRSRMFRLSLLIMNISYYWYLSARTFGALTGLNLNLIFYLIASLVLHGCWIIAPIFAYLSLIHKNTEASTAKG